MPLPTPTTKLSALITTVDPSQQLIEGVFKTAGKAHIEVFNKPPAFRWPVVGEVWMVRQENGSWQLDNLWPSTNVFTVTENPVVPVVANQGDLVLNSATGVIHVEGSLDGTTDYTLDFAGIPLPVTGSRGGNAALQSLLSQLAALGLIDDQTV